MAFFGKKIGSGDKPPDQNLLVACQELIEAEAARGRAEEEVYAALRTGTGVFADLAWKYQTNTSLKELQICTVVSTNMDKFINHCRWHPGGGQAAGSSNAAAITAVPTSTTAAALAFDEITTAAVNAKALVHRQLQVKDSALKRLQAEQDDLMVK